MDIRDTNGGRRKEIERYSTDMMRYKRTYRDKAYTVIV
jgi:hypothetical protein